MSYTKAQIEACQRMIAENLDYDMTDLADGYLFVNYGGEAWLVFQGDTCSLNDMQKLDFVL